MDHQVTGITGRRSGRIRERLLPRLEVTRRPQKGDFKCVEPMISKRDNTPRVSLVRRVVGKRLYDRGFQLMGGEVDRVLVSAQARIRPRGIRARSDLRSAGGNLIEESVMCNHGFGKYE